MPNQNSLTPSKRFKKLVNQLHHYTQQIETDVPLEALAEPDTLPDATRSRIAQPLANVMRMITHLWHEHMDSIERGNPILSGVGDEARRCYRRVWDKRQAIRAADNSINAIDLSDLLSDEDEQSNCYSDNDPSASVTQRGAPSPTVDTALSERDAYAKPRDLVEGNRIRHFMSTQVENAYPFIEDGEIDIAMEEFAAAESIVNAEWFQPDQWAHTMNNMRLLISSRGDDEVPPLWLRLRIKDLYHALVTGNPVAAITLARATVETALRLRVDDLIRPNDTPMTSPDKERAGFQEWVSYYRSAGIDIQTDRLAELGRCAGKAIHQAGDTELSTPIRAQDKAIECASIAIEAVEDLYRRKKGD